MPQQVPGTIGRATSSIPKTVGKIQQGKGSPLLNATKENVLGSIKKNKNSDVSVGGGMNPVASPGMNSVGMGGLAGNPFAPVGQTPAQTPQMPSVTGMSPGMVPGQYGGMVTPDADGRGFTNADGGHDWNVGQGPGGDWKGEDQTTGQPPIGQDPGSGDALGIPRGTPAYRQATAAHKNWIQQNRAAGRTLADLGMSPTRGGGLANFMEMAGTPRGAITPGNPTNPTLPSTGLGKGVPSTPYTGPGFINTPVSDPLAKTGLGGNPVASNPYTGPGFVGNNMSPGAVPTPQPQLTAQRRQPMKSMGFGQRPMNTSRLM